jgi:hypothetical protein
MKNLTKLMLALALLAAGAGTGMAQDIPVVDSWDVELTAPADHPVSVIRGETKYLRPRYLVNGAAATITNVTSVQLWYKPSGLATASWFYVTNGTVIGSGVVQVPWSPACESTWSEYNYNVVAATALGNSLSAAGKLTLRGNVTGSQTTAPPGRVVYVSDSATYVTNGGATVDGQVVSNGAVIVTAVATVPAWTNIAGIPTIWIGTATDDVARAAIIVETNRAQQAEALLLPRAATNEAEWGSHANLATKLEGWQNPSNVSFFTWTTNATKTGISITGYNTDGGTHPVIPRFINGYPVVDIKGGPGWGDGVFFGLDPELQGIELPDTLQTIGQGAFYWTGLRRVTIPASVTNIAEDAFAVNVYLTNVSFYGNAPANGYRAFNGDDNMTVYILDPLATGWGSTWYGRPVVRPKVYTDVAFQDNNTVSNLTSAALISGVLSTKTPGLEVGKLTLSTSYAGADPASRNDLVLTATGAASNASLFAVAGDMTIGGTLTGGGVVGTNDARYLAALTNAAAFATAAQGTKADTAWQNPASSTNWTWTSDGTNITLTGYTGPNDVVIPDMLDNLPVTGFGTIFAGDPITSISGGGNVASIVDYGFNECQVLTSVTLPSVASVGSHAFKNCYFLTSIKLPSATSIGEEAFNDIATSASVYFGQNAPAEAYGVYSGFGDEINYVTSPTATGWGETWNGRPVVRLPVYADNFYGSGTGITGITAAQVGAISTNGGTLTGPLLTTLDHITTPPGDYELPSARWVRGLAMAGSECYFTQTITNGFGNKTTNFVLLSETLPASMFTNSIASPIASSTYFAGGICTNLRTAIRSTITIDAWLARVGGTAVSTIPIFGEIYYIYAGTTNHLGDWTVGPLYLTDTTPQHMQWVVAFNAPTVTGAVQVIGYLKTGTVSGPAAGVNIYGGGQYSSHMDIQSSASEYTLTAAGIAAAGGLTNAVVKAITTYSTTNPVITLSESANAWNWTPPTNVPLSCTFSGPGAGWAGSGMLRLVRTNGDNSVSWPTNALFFVNGTRTTNAPTLSNYNRFVVDYFDGMWTLGLVSTNSVSL